MKNNFLAAYSMSFSSVHRGGATRDLSVELRRLLLGSCGGGGAKGLFWGGFCVSRPAAANGARALVGARLSLSEAPAQL
eukprot:6212414-Pleurochrysis_carterae.AAC.9